MESVVKFIGLLVLVLVLQCTCTTVMTEMHLIPRQAAGQSGVRISEMGGPQKLDPNKREAQYPDFWMVDSAGEGSGYTAQVEDGHGKSQVQFPMSF